MFQGRDHPIIIHCSFPSLEKLQWDAVTLRCEVGSWFLLEGQGKLAIKKCIFLCYVLLGVILFGKKQILVEMALLVSPHVLTRKIIAVRKCCWVADASDGQLNRAWRFRKWTQANEQGMDKNKNEIFFVSVPWLNSRPSSITVYWFPDSVSFLSFRFYTIVHCSLLFVCFINMVQKHFSCQ